MASIILNARLRSNLASRLAWMSGTLLLTCATAASAVSVTPAAETNSLAEYFEDLPVVLSASRLRQSAVEAPAAVTVIDREMIVASGARRLLDVLRLVPGFYVGYLNGNSPVVAYHGLSDFYAKRMQVLIDGVSIYSPLFGGVEWTELPLTLQDIERIEVVRGPNAVTYGANAFLGVINIISRDPAMEPAWQAGMNAGGNGIRDLVLRASRQGENLRYRVSLGQRNDDGYSNLPDSQRMDLANMRAEYRLDAANELSFQVRASQGHETQGRNLTQGFYKINIGNGQFDPERSRKVEQQTLQARWTRATDVDNEFWLQVYHHERRVREISEVMLPLPGGAQLPYAYDSNIDVKRDDIEFQQARRLAETLRMVWGGQWRQDGARAHAFFNSYDEQTNRLGRLFGNLEVHPLDGLMLHGGVMFEHNSLTGSSSSPRLAATYNFLPGQSLRIGVSRANRTPTLNEDRGTLIYPSPSSLLWLTHGLPLAILIKASGHLQEEEILSREIGYTVEVAQWKMGGDIRWFNDQVSRLITLGLTHPVVTMTNSMTWDYANSPSPARVHGIELSGHWHPWSGAQLNLTTAYTRIDSDILDSAQSAPSSTASLLFSQALPRDTTFSVGGYKVGSMKWQSSSAGLPAYNTLDLRLAKLYRWGDQRLEVALVTRNAMGNYLNYNTVNQERRTSFVQLNYAF